MDYIFHPLYSMSVIHKNLLAFGVNYLISLRVVAGDPVVAAAAADGVLGVRLSGPPADGLQVRSEQPDHPLGRAGPSAAVPSVGLLRQGSALHQRLLLRALRAAAGIHQRICGHHLHPAGQ